MLLKYVFTFNKTSLIKFFGSTSRWRYKIILELHCNLDSSKKILESVNLFNATQFKLQVGISANNLSCKKESVYLYIYIYFCLFTSTSACSFLPLYYFAFLSFSQTIHISLCLYFSFVLIDCKLSILFSLSLSHSFISVYL